MQTFATHKNAFL